MAAHFFVGASGQCVAAQGAKREHALVQRGVLCCDHGGLCREHKGPRTLSRNRPAAGTIGATKHGGHLGRATVAFGFVVACRRTGVAGASGSSGHSMRDALPGSLLARRPSHRYGTRVGLGEFGDTAETQRRGNSVGRVGFVANENAGPPNAPDSHLVGLPLVLRPLQRRRVLDDHDV
jgi:hypothetical protein